MEETSLKGSHIMDPVLHHPSFNCSPSIYWDLLCDRNHTRVGVLVLSKGSEMYAHVIAMQWGRCQKRGSWLPLRGGGRRIAVYVGRSCQGGHGDELHPKNKEWPIQRSGFSMSMETGTVILTLVSSGRSASSDVWQLLSNVCDWEEEGKEAVPSVRVRWSCQEQKRPK